MEEKCLEEIMDGVNAKVAAWEELEEKRRTMEKEAVATVNGNFKTLFYPEISRLFDFCVTLAHKVNLDVRLNAFRTDELDDARAREDFFLSMDCLNSDFNKIIYMWFKGVDGKMHNWDLRFLKEKTDSFDILSWLRYFGTEEDTLKTLEKARGCFAVWFGRFLKCLEPEQRHLEDMVRSLEDALNGSSAVKEKEDGTIELKINGKVYVGKVKEEE